MILIQTSRHIQSSTKLLLLLLVLFLGACSADMDGLISKEDEKAMLPISFSLPITTYSSGGLVSEIRLLAFDRTTGSCIKNTLIAFNGSTTLPTNPANRTSDPILMPPGTFNFLFIANESSTILDNGFRNALYNVSEAAHLNNAAFNDIIFSSYTNTNVESEMPMSAYYSSIYLPNASYDYNDPFRFPYMIELVRALAKIEINLFNKIPQTPTIKRVTKLTVSNVGKRFSLPALSEFYSSFYDASTMQNLVLPIAFTEDKYEDESIGQLLLYVPEFLKDKNVATPPKTILRFEGTGFIPYEFVLLEEIKNIGYKQPRILDFNTLSNYSIVRNTHYKLNIFLSINRVLEGVLEVLPWEKIESEINFSKPKFELSNFSIKVGGVERKSDQEVSLKTNQEAVITFRLDNPTGGIWKASLTNGFNFDFSGTGLPRGIAGTEYTFNVKATKPWNGTPTYTEFYIAVAGAELPLWNNTTGLNERYVFKQIE